MNKRSLAAAIMLIGVGIIFGVVLVSNFGNGRVGSLFAGGVKDIGAKNPPIVVNETVRALNDAYKAVSKSVNPSVVSINVLTETKVPKNRLPDIFKFFGQPDDGSQDNGEEDRTQKSEGAGSGVIVSEDGYIVTNNHVVEDASADGIKVIFSDKKEYKAKLIGRDPLTDIAVLKIEAKGLPAVHFGNSDDVQVGEMVLAVGNPLGLHSTVTSGIVSALGRGALGLNRGSYAIENFIQIDAAINPGNSGGGLFNLQGSLIGINSAIASRTGYFSGYGFAIPINLAKAVVLDIMDDGKVDRGYIGVQIRSVDEVIAKSMKLESVAGVLVDNVLSDGAASKAGIETGDVILELDGVPVNTSNELQSRVVQHRAGESVKLKIWREGKMITKSVTLQPREEDKLASNAKKGNAPGEEMDEDSNKPVVFKQLGFTIGALTEKAKKDNEVESGVLITKVDQFSEAAERGLFPNAVIVKADKQAIQTPAQLKKAIDSKRGDVVRLQLKTKDGTRLIFIEVPKENS
ncbi:MAG: Do family serine endopeptidase [Bacteroidetes bacterium]|nr:Do family serine endopeptidase [Bacteroidota bacterium]